MNQIATMDAPPPAQDEQPVFWSLDYSGFKALIAGCELTHREVAHLCGVHYNSVSRWCSESAADRQPAPRYAVALLNAYRLMDLDQRGRFVRGMNRMVGAS